MKLPLYFSGVKAIVAMSFAVAATAIMSPQFVHAGESTAAAAAPTDAVVVAQISSEGVSTPTPASMNFHDGINVSAIAVAAYDR